MVSCGILTSFLFAEGPTKLENCLHPRGTWSLGILGRRKSLWPQEGRIEENSEDETPRENEGGGTGGETCLGGGNIHCPPVPI